MLPHRVWSVVFRQVPFIGPLKLRNSMKIDEDFRLFLEVYHCFAFLAALDELYEELGAFRRTEYLKGGDVRDTYLKPQPNASGKTGSNNYEDKPIPKLKDPE